MERIDEHKLEKCNMEGVSIAVGTPMTRRCGRAHTTNAAATYIILVDFVVFEPDVAIYLHKGPCAERGIGTPGFPLQTQCH
jgi:hypothetical protein